MKFGMPELLIILLIIIIVIGPTQLPKLKRMFKKSGKELRDAVAGREEDEPD